MTQQIVPQEERHRARMQRKKTVIDAVIAQAQACRGLLLVLSGNGKGKSTAAFGMVARALGHGLRVGVVQFVKSQSATGEASFFRQQPGVRWELFGNGFSWETQDLEQDAHAARRGWAVAQEMLRDERIALVVLDELTYPLRSGALTVDSILADLAQRPAGQHVVVTGRGAPAALIAAADTVSELADVKHAFRAGIRAQKGVDW